MIIFVIRFQLQMCLIDWARDVPSVYTKRLQVQCLIVSYEVYGKGSV
jgi:hypothetical protein